MDKCRYLLFLVIIFVMGANFGLNARWNHHDDKYVFERSEKFCSPSCCLFPCENWKLSVMKDDNGCDDQREAYMSNLKIKFPEKLDCHDDQYKAIYFERIIAATSELVKNLTVLSLLHYKNQQALNSVNSWDIFHYFRQENRDNKAPVFDIKLANDIVVYLKKVILEYRSCMVDSCPAYKTMFGSFDLDLFGKALSAVQPSCWFIEWFVTKYCHFAKDEFVCQILSTSIASCCIVGVSSALQVLQNRGFDVASFLNNTVDGKIGDTTKLDELVLARNDENIAKWGNKFKDFDPICEILMKNGALVHSDYITVDNANVLLLSCSYNSLR